MCCFPHTVRCCCVWCTLSWNHRPDPMWIRRKYPPTTRVGCLLSDGSRVLSNQPQSRICIWQTLLPISFWSGNNQQTYVTSWQKTFGFSTATGHGHRRATPYAMPRNGTGWMPESSKLSCPRLCCVVVAPAPISYDGGFSRYEGTIKFCHGEVFGLMKIEMIASWRTPQLSMRRTVTETWHFMETLEGFLW